MATAKKRKSPRQRTWLWLLAILVAAGAALYWYYRVPITGVTRVGASYGARVACSCRFVAGRELADCGKDFLPGMELASLSEDADAKSVTVSFPLIASETATYKEGYGCVLEKWKR